MPAEDPERPDGSVRLRRVAVRPGRYERGGRDGEGGGENTTAPGSVWPDGQGTTAGGSQGSTSQVALATIVGYPPIADTLPTALRWLVAIVRFVILGGLLVVGLAVLYRYAPDRDQPKWSWVSWGSGIAALLWVLATIGFAVYANFFGNYNKTYGALAGVIILMFWLFLSAVVVLVGAELNTEMELQTAKDTTAGPTRPMGDRDAHAADHVAEAPR
jgi:membrane protein